MTENELSYIIRGAIFNVHSQLGAGLLESLYEHALAYELTKRGLNIKTQYPIHVKYDESLLELGFRADIIVNDKVIIEVKSIEEIAPVHHKQLLTYLKLTNLKLGILVNFNTDNIEKSIFRKVNNL